MKRLLAVCVVIILLIFYMSFLQYKNVGKIELSGYIVANQNVLETIKEDEPDEIIELTKVTENEVIYKQNEKYFVGEIEKKEIQISYPVIADDNSKILNIDDNVKLVNKEYEKENSFKNMIIASKNLYNTVNYEQVDEEEYYFLMFEDYVYVNNIDIEVHSTDTVIIPKYSIILLEQNSIKYYYKDDDVLKLNVIEGISNNTILKLDEEIEYYELLKNLELVQEEEQEEQVEVEEKDNKDNIIDDGNKGGLIIDSEPGKIEWVKPEVTINNIDTNIYSVKADLVIYDPSGVIKKDPTFEVIYKGETYLRKTFYSSGVIEIPGLLPSTEFKIIGSFNYLNEDGTQIKKTFVEQTINTKDMTNIEVLDISYKVNEIHSNKGVLNEVKLLNESTDEVLKGIKKAVIKIGDKEYNFSQSNISKLKRLEEFDFSIVSNIDSNTTYTGDIEIYDVANNKLKIKNNKIEFKTSRQQPSVVVSVKETDITKFKLGVEVINKDDVNIENLRYEIYDFDQVLKCRGEVKDNIIECGNLSANQIYKVKVYGDFDLLDGFGNRIDYLFKETSVSTAPISSLGMVRLSFKEKEITSDKIVFSVDIDEKATDSRLIDLLYKFEVYIDDNKVLEFKDEEEIKFDNLDSNTEYIVKIKTIIKQGDIEYTLDTLSNIDTFMTLKEDAQVYIINMFSNNDMIDFDVLVRDKDKAIISNRVILEVRNSNSKLVLMEDIQINSDYERITLEKLDKNEEYTFKFIAEEYNVGYTNLTYEASKIIKEIKLYTEEGISGKLELSSLLNQITSNNLFDINNKSKWIKEGGSTLNEIAINENLLKLSSVNGQAVYRYYLPEYKGKKIKIRFFARQADGSNNQQAYLRYNSSNKALNLTSEYQEFTYEFTMTGVYLFGFTINEVSNNNTKTTIEIKDLYVTESSNYNNSYEKYTEKERYLGKIYTTLIDVKEEIKNNEYYIKVVKNNSNEQLYSYSLNNLHCITRELNEYELDKNVTYKLTLLIKIRDRYYELDEIEIVTDDEIRAIETSSDLFSIHPYANYIVINDLDLRNIGSAVYITYYGTIDFQGHSVYSKSSKRQYLFYQTSASAVIKNIDFHIDYDSLSWYRGSLVMYNYGKVSNVMCTIDGAINDYQSYNGMMYVNYGILEQFVIKLDAELYAQDRTTLGVVHNYGTIKNGYLYGKTFYAKTNTGVIIGYASNSSYMENVYSIVDIVPVEEQTSIGSISGNTYYSIFKNIYTYSENTDRTTTKDINFGYISNINTDNVFYINPNLHINSQSLKLSKVALRNASFQEILLNSANAFNVEDYVTYGYYPQIILNEVMPKQEYIELPEIKDEDLADILSVDDVEELGSEAIVKLLIHNPSGEKITRIGVKDLTTEILDQSTENDLTTLTLKLSNPLKYISMYYIKEIETSGAFNIKYTRSYDDYEKILNVNMYKSIYTVDDWKNIKNGNSWNYRLEADLDFSNLPNNAYVGNFYGVLDGNNHTIENIEISGTCGVFCNLKGTIKNLYVNDLKSTNANATYNGFISTTTAATINNVHLSNVTLTLGPRQNGALVGYAYYGTDVTNCSVTNMIVINNSNLQYGTVGGLIGLTYSINVSNCYVQDINFDINEGYSTDGVGGLIGYAQGSIVTDCYASGIISTEFPNVGGLIGQTNGSSTTNRVYSNVDIYSKSSYVGGIVGKLVESYTIGNSLAVGNLYTSVITNYIGRIVGNNVYINSNNYAWNNQHVNGELTNLKNGEVLLSKETLYDIETYLNIIQFGDAYSYDDIDGKLPKLYYKDTNKLLPNQKDIILNEMNFEILESANNKSVEEAYVMFRIENKDEVSITDIEIEDMEVKEIRKNQTENGVTVIEVLVKPIRYYDSYRLRKIKYNDNGIEKVFILNYRIDIQFYKDIESFEDWQNIDGEYAENYRLVADIDFKDKKNININVIFNRLEGMDDGHTLKNFEYKTTSGNTYLIKEVKTSLKNVNFEGFNLTSSKSYNGLAIIGYTYGDLINVNFINNKIIADNSSYVGNIAYNYADVTRDINLSDIEVRGYNYVGAFSAKNTFFAQNNITLNNIKVTGRTYTGGMTGFKDYNWTNYHFYIEANNVEVYCKSGSDCGGVYGYGGAYYVYGKNINVTGYNEVGGISGYSGHPIHYNEISENSVVVGSNNYAGGILGRGSYIYYSKVRDVSVTGKYYVGGLSGSSSTKQYNSLVNVYVEGSNYVGGVEGYYGGVFDYGELINVTVKGNNYIGGAYGTKSNISDARISHSTLNVDVQATGNIVGGIIGYFPNNQISGTNGRLQIYRNIIENSNISGQNYVGGLIGKMEIEFGDESQYIYNNIIVANVTSCDDSTNSGMIIGNSDLNAIGLKNIKIYNKSKLNNEQVTNNTVLPETSFITRDKLLIQSTYTNLGMWTSYFNYNVLKDNYYPVLKTANKGDYVSIPTDEVQVRALLFRKSVMYPSVFVYPVDVNKINIEFSTISDYLKLEVNGKEYPLIEKTMTFFYDYKNDVNIKIKDLINEISYTFKLEDLKRSLSTYNNTYSYIKDNNLFVNNEYVSNNFIHLYNNKALTNDNYIYDIVSKEKIENNIDNLSRCKETFSISEYSYNGMNIKVFYSYTLVDQKQINKQIFYKNGKLSMLSNTMNNYKDSIIIDSYNNKDYLLVLSDESEIYNLKNEIKYPNSFKNYDIVEMNNNLNDNSGIILVRYEDGSIYGFDYRTGREVVNNSNYVDLISYVKNTFKALNKETFDSKYQESYNSILSFKDTIKEDVKDSIESYDSLKEEYEIYDTNTYLKGQSNNIVKDNELSINDNIYQDYELIEKYESTLKVNEMSKTGINIVYAIIIMITLFLTTYILGRLIKDDKKTE